MARPKETEIIEKDGLFYRVELRCRNCGGWKDKSRPNPCRCNRPTVMTDATLGKLESAFIIGATDLEACAIADIHPASLYRYQGENPAFCERKKMLKERLKSVAKGTISEALNPEKNPEIEKRVEHAKWYLERKAKDEFGKEKDGAPPGGNTYNIVVFGATDPVKRIATIVHGNHDSVQLETGATSAPDPSTTAAVPGAGDAQKELEDYLSDQPTHSMGNGEPGDVLVHRAVPEPSEEDRLAGPGDAPEVLSTEYLGSPE